MSSSPPSMTIITRVTLPAYLSPEVMLDALQTYEPLIMASPYLKSYERRQIRVEELVDDAFFREDGRKIEAFVVYDKVPIIPGLGNWAAKAVRIPCVFQSFEYGVRCRADSEAGVTVRSSYEVRKRGEVREGPPAVPGPDDGEFELVETANISCGALVKAFVRRSFTSAHQATLQCVVDETARMYGHGQAAQSQDQGYSHAQPALNLGYGHAQPVQNLGYGHAQPVLNQGYVHAQPVQNQGYSHDQPGQGQGYASSL